MSIWEKYSQEQRKEYIQFLQVYGALSKLFRQKQNNLVPHLDYKFQETVFSKVFKCQNVDIGNTPHDVLSVFGNSRIGIGLKTWLGSGPSFQKVMQIKSDQNEINKSKINKEELAFKISSIKNEKMLRDYNRLGLTENLNIYHYVTRDNGVFTINECSYPLIDLNNLQGIRLDKNALQWSDGKKEYKYTFGDSQIFQKFDPIKKDSLILNRFDVKIIDDPFSFLLKAYHDIIKSTPIIGQEIIEAYLPLYSFDSNKVEQKSGLNAWNAAPKSKNSNSIRPLNEIYIPIPRIFHKTHPEFFTKNIFKAEAERENYNGPKETKPEVRFHLQLPNGKIIPALVTQDNMKGLQSGSNTEYDENGKRYGQSALGQWLLIDVLGLKERKLVTREWLQKRGTDSVKIWRRKNDYNTFYIDFAPIGAFEAFIKNEPIPVEDN